MGGGFAQWNACLCVFGYVSSNLVIGVDGSIVYVRGNACDGSAV